MNRRQVWSGVPVLGGCLLLAACATQTPQPTLDTATLATPVVPSGQAAPAPPAVRRYTIETLLGSLRLNGSDISADGRRVLFTSNQSGVPNVYAVDFEGGTPQALTHSTTDSMQAIGWFPEDDRVLYTADQGGNERNHLYVREIDGAVLDLTPGDTLKAAFSGFSHDRRAFYVATNERDERYFDLYRYAIGTRSYPRELLFRNDSGLQPAAVSRDERYVALVQVHTTSDSDVLVHDLRTGQQRNLTAHEGVESNAVAGFTPAGDLLVMSNRGGEFARLVRIDPVSGNRSVVYQADWDVVGAGYSPDDQYLLVYLNADARTELVLLDALTLTPVRLPAVPAGDITGVSFSEDSRRLAFYVASSRFPSSLWTAELGGQARELVAAQSPEVQVSDLVEGQVVRFASYDGMQIPGILYLPHGASAERPAPALVWVHGGPGGQSRLSYSPLIQYLVNHGYAVYAINNRGSSGYGKRFYAADDRKHGEADLDDVVASKQMLIDTGVIDPRRIGIIGGSYGGYMTLAALAFRPGVFTLGVDIFGVANWVRTLESIPPWWESQRKALYAELGDPVVDKERLMRISPLFHAGNIRQPLMVLQGANDPRVLQVESDEIVAAVRANGVPVEYVVFDDEGHGFAKRANEARGYAAVLAFLEQHLR